MKLWKQIETMNNDVKEQEPIITSKDPSQTKKRRPYAKLGFSKLETAELVDALNKLIANFSLHYQKLRNFHWNVKGSDFFDIHEQFEIQYNDTKVAVDDLAERIRVFGQTPISNLSDFLNTAEIQEAETNLSAHEMVKEIIKDYEILVEYMYRALDVSIENGDSGTEDMIKSFIKKTEKNHWMMTAFSSGE